MSPPLADTRRALHGVAELLVAGPQYRATGTMRLASRPGGFGTTRPYGDVELVAVDGTDLLVVRGSASRIPLAGTCAALAAAAGLEIGGLAEAYAGSSGVSPDEELTVDPAAAAVLAAAWAVGDAALRALGGDGGPEPVLWPEHFDVGVTLDAVNYGVSPGDADIPEPYAYVGPHTPRTGPFWNAPFGAAQPLRELGGEVAVLAFFAQGRVLAGTGR
ncbi:MAG: hypothetical protein ACJ73E_17455 [Mycobacteriales bacterium]